MRERVYEGIGVAVLRGLDIDAYTDEEVATIYLGLSSYIAERRGKQDQRGTMLSESDISTSEQASNTWIFKVTS